MTYVDEMNDTAKKMELPLPEDYTINNSQVQIDNEVMTNYIYRLLPLPLGSSLTSTSKSNIQNTSGV